MKQLVCGANRNMGLLILVEMVDTVVKNVGSRPCHVGSCPGSAIYKMRNVDNFYNLSVLLLPYSENEDNNSTSLPEWL